LPSLCNQPFTSFPSSLAALPTLEIVVPDNLHNMHDGSIQQGDDWLEANIHGYYQWAMTHNSLLIVTFDEDDFTDVNQIATIFAGPMVKRGQYGQAINHFSVLRTIEALLGLSYIGAAASATTISDSFYSQSRAWLEGDANFDATVDSLDFNVLASNFNGSAQSWPTGDFNGDGLTNALDFNALAMYYGQT